MMKKTTLFLFCLLAGLVSCNSEGDWLDSFLKLDDEQYVVYVADALEAMNMPRPKGSYNYPCLPGMPAWKDLKSSGEMERVLRIPQKTLKRQSTQAVIQAIWEHPDFPMYLYLSSSSFMQKVVEQFFFNQNTYKELIKRTDAGSCLVERYYRMNMTKSIHAFYNCSLQLLLSQNVFLDQLTLDEKVQLTKKMVERMEDVRMVIQVEPDKQSLSTDPIYFCLVRIMANSKYAPMLYWMEEDESAQKFEESGDWFYLTTDSFRTKILELSANFINGNIYE